MMNPILDLWHLPWHEMQRSLAEGFVVETAPVLAGIALTWNACNTANSAPSWLERARAQIKIVTTRTP